MCPVVAITGGCALNNVIPGALHKKSNIQAGHALLSQEGSATLWVARGEVPLAGLCGMRLWNPLSREFDCAASPLRLTRAVPLTQGDATLA